MTTRFWTLAAASETTAFDHPRTGLQSLLQTANHLTLGWLNRPFTPTMTVYHITDQLHAGRVADVPADQIAPTVSAWLAELGVQSPLVEDLARAARAGDWPAVYAVGEHLSVEVTLAAAA
ncbi:hypothetical protein [Mycobacterium szulgai]